MIASAFFFHLISALVIIALGGLVVKLRSRISFLRSIFQLLKHSDGHYKRRLFVSDPKDLLMSFSRVFGIEILTSGMSQSLKRIDVTTLLKLHYEYQISQIEYSLEKTQIHVVKMPCIEESSNLKNQLLLDFSTQKIVFLETKTLAREKFSNPNRL